MSDSSASMSSSALYYIEPDMVLKTGKAVIEAEAKALAELPNKLDASFVQAVQYLADCSGRIVITGVGKSGLIGQKMSATFASIGAPSHFVHAADAMHGDLGRITQNDVVIALSNSGETHEIVRLLRPVKDFGAVLIAITASNSSTLAREAHTSIIIGKVPEACPMGLIPTTSTTITLAVGDALAVALANARGLDHDGFARYHPGGPIGRRILKVRQVMRADAVLPVVRSADSLRDVLRILAAAPGRPGSTAVVDSRGVLTGFFSIGDLRRQFERDDFALDIPIGSVASQELVNASINATLAEAEQLLTRHKLDQLPVVDERGSPIGYIDLQDVLLAKAA